MSIPKSKMLSASRAIMAIANKTRESREITHKAIQNQTVKSLQTNYQQTNQQGNQHHVDQGRRCQMSTEEINQEKVKMFSEKIAKIKSELAKDVVGQADIIDGVIEGLM